MKEDKSQAVIDRIADKHGVSSGAVASALEALRRGGGTMAQFSHADFGGMAQWSKGGMSMVGDMFNSSIKAKLDGVLADLSEAMQGSDLSDKANAAKPSDVRSSPHSGSSDWWPNELGHPSSSGGQNDMRYAFFPQAKRLVVRSKGEQTVYDTGSHMISGVSQQQSTDQTLHFRSQLGDVVLSELRVIK